MVKDLRLPVSRVKVDFSALVRWQNVVKARSGAVKIGLRQWGVIYRAAMQERFVKFSMGGGNWRKLSSITIKHRRQAKRNTRFGRTASILRDTGTLFAALNPVLSPGSQEELTKFGILVGFGGTAKHPSSRRGKSIKQIADIHQSGIPGRLPKREIIVKPDKITTDVMAGVMEKAVESEYI